MVNWLARASSNPVRSAGMPSTTFGPIDPKVDEAGRAELFTAFFLAHIAWRIDSAPF
jgi:hypothetical protein